MSVSTLVLLGLALVWAVVLLPEVLKRVSSVRRGDSIRSFSNQLSSMQYPDRRRESSGADVIDLRSRAAGPRPVHPAVRKRRQEVLTGLAAATGVGLLASVAFGGVFLLLFLLSAGLLVAYVVALHQVTNGPAARPASRGTAAPVVRAAPSRTLTRVDSPALGRIAPVTAHARRIAN